MNINILIDYIFYIFCVYFKKRVTAQFCFLNNSCKCLEKPFPFFRYVTAQPNKSKHNTEDLPGAASPPGVLSRRAVPPFTAVTEEPGERMAAGGLT